MGDDYYREQRFREELDEARRYEARIYEARLHEARLYEARRYEAERRKIREAERQENREAERREQEARLLEEMRIRAVAAKIAEEEARMKAEFEARMKAEFEAKKKAEEEAKKKAEEEAKKKAEEEAKKKGEEEAKKKAEEEAKKIAEEEAKKIAEEEAKKIAEEEAKKKAKEEKENEEMKNAIKFTADFYKDLMEKYGEHSSKISNELAEAAKGKKIRNAEEALKAYDKYKDILNKKFSVKDREAISKALESVDRNEIAKNLGKFAKVFGIVGNAIDVADLYDEVKKGFATGDWNGAIRKAESIAVGKAAGYIVAFTFGVMTATPIGILGYAALMTVTSALIDDEMMDKMNNFFSDL